MVSLSGSATGKGTEMEKGVGKRLASLLGLCTLQTERVVWKPELEICIRWKQRRSHKGAPGGLLSLLVLEAPKPENSSS